MKPFYLNRVSLVFPVLKLSMRHFLSLVLMGIVGWSAASAWAFPEKPLRIVIGFPAGGPLDQHARLLSERLQQVLGQPVLIDYKAGAGGTVGA